MLKLYAIIYIQHCTLKLRQQKKEGLPMLFLSGMKVFDYAAIGSASLKFDRTQRPNILFGQNGVGKTTVVNAIKVFKALAEGKTISDYIEDFDFREEVITLAFEFNDDEIENYRAIYISTIDRNKRVVAESLKDNSDLVLSVVLRTSEGKITQLRGELGAERVCALQDHQMLVYREGRSVIFDDESIKALDSISYPWGRIAPRLRRYAQKIVFADAVPQVIVDKQERLFFADAMELLECSRLHRKDGDVIYVEYDAYGHPFVVTCQGDDNHRVPLVRESAGIQEYARIVWARVRIDSQWHKSDGKPDDCYPTIIVDDIGQSMASLELYEAIHLFRDDESWNSVHSIVTSKNEALLDENYGSNEEYYKSIQYGTTDPANRFRPMRGLGQPPV